MMRFLCTLMTLAAALTIQAEPLRVVATTAMVADLARRVGGPDATVDQLMGPGVDPHLYRPTPSDLARLRSSEMIVYSGLHLEGKMSDMLESLQRSRVVVELAAASPVERRIVHAGDAHADPHLWFDVALWSETLPALEKAYSKLRPALAEQFSQRAAQARTELQALDAWVRAELASIPKERRVLVTSHDAFSYFGRAYGFEVVALQGISTAGEAGLADLSRLITFVRERRLPAIFIESSVPPATLNRVASESGARIGGELFSDAAGSEGGTIDGVALSSYEGMMRHNVHTLVAALRGEAP
jgi:manganese/zinc/iron transport system substrate-binding protein